MSFLSIHVTDLCNSACEFCVVSAPQQTRDSVDYERILQFLQENAGSDYHAVNLHGGEPTLYPRFFELLEAIRNFGYLEVHLQTNAYRLADLSFLDQVIAAGVSLFVVSLHGSCPAIHDSQTGMKSGFDHVVRAIRAIREKGMRVRTNTVVTRANLADLMDTCRLAHDLDVNQVNISCLHPVGSARDIRQRVMPTLTEMEPCVMAAVDYIRASGHQVILEGFPFCMVKERTADHLNSLPRNVRMLIRGHVIDDYDKFMVRSMRVLGEECKHCVLSKQCGGVYPEYAELYGWNEIHAIQYLSELEAPMCT